MLVVLVLFLTTRDFFGFEIGLPNVLLFFLSMFLAVTLNFLIFFCVGILAFWFSEVSYLFMSISALINLTGGGLFPLDVFGPVINGILNYLSFKYTIYFQISILKTDNIEYICRGLVIQLLWICILVVVGNIWWNRGMNKYISAGG